MSTHTAKAQLRDVLAKLYSSESDARRVVADSGMDEQRIQFSSHSISNWQAILTEAEKAGKVEAVLDIAVQDYPGNVALLTAAIEWQSVRLRALGVSSAPRRTWMRWMCWHS